MVNRQQLFNLKKSQEDPISVDPGIGVPKFDPKLCRNQNLKFCHHNGTRSNNKVTPMPVTSVDTELKSELRGSLDQWVSRLVVAIKGTAVSL